MGRLASLARFILCVLCYLCCIGAHLIVTISFLLFLAFHGTVRFFPARGGHGKTTGISSSPSQNSTSETSASLSRSRHTSGKVRTAARGDLNRLEPSWSCSRLHSSAANVQKSAY